MSPPLFCCSNLAGAGFTEPTPIQRQAATALLAGRELLAVAPTGSGKTLGFLLPLLMLVRRLKAEEHAAEQAAAAAGGEGSEGGSGGDEEEGEGARSSSSLKAVVVRCAPLAGGLPRAAGCCLMLLLLLLQRRLCAFPAWIASAAPLAAEPTRPLFAILIFAHPAALIMCAPLGCSPTKELSVQTARVLKLLLPGLRTRCSVLSKATAAGTDFNKVGWSAVLAR